jgi:hypothetical protein
MALAKIDLFGAPEYGALKGEEGAVFHTPENASPSIEDAIATARWQATASNSSGGSYHLILGYDDDLGLMSNPNAWVAVKTVRFTRIAGSISTRRDSIWQPDRFPWLQQMLSPAAYADPNAYLHALCLSGKARWWSEKLSTKAGRAEVNGAIIRMAQWVKRLEDEFDYDSVLNLHRHWQTNRTDPDGLNFADLVLDAYAALTAAPAPAPQVTVAELQSTIAAKDLRIQRLEARLDDKNTSFDAALAGVRTARMAIIAGKEA